MSNNPYSSNFNYGAGPAARPSRPNFVDPYQPKDAQPLYPPPVYRDELAATSPAGVAGASSGASALTARSSDGAVPDTGNSQLVAALCLGLCALLWFGHVGILDLGVAAIWFAVASSRFVKRWAAAAFNFTVTACVISAIASGVSYFALQPHSYQTASLLDTAVVVLLALVFVVMAIRAVTGKASRAKLGPRILHL